MNMENIFMMYLEDFIIYLYYIQNPMNIRKRAIGRKDQRLSSYINMILKVMIGFKR